MTSTSTTTSTTTASDPYEDTLGTTPYAEKIDPFDKNSDASKKSENPYSKALDPANLKDSPKVKDPYEGNLDPDATETDPFEQTLDPSKKDTKDSEVKSKDPYTDSVDPYTKVNPYSPGSNTSTLNEAAKDEPLVAPSNNSSKPKEDLREVLEEALTSAGKVTGEVIDEYILKFEQHEEYSKYLDVTYVRALTDEQFSDIFDEMIMMANRIRLGNWLKANPVTSKKRPITKMDHIQVAEWFRNLGYEEIAKTCMSYRIDGWSLQAFTAYDIGDIGVELDGENRKNFDQKLERLKTNGF